MITSVVGYLNGLNFTFTGRKNMKINLLIISAFFIVLSSCGGGSGGDSGSANPLSTGTFVDSPVINIGYRTETQNGVTNSRGEFKYFPGETVIFFIGDLEFPSVLADEIVTPLDIAGTDDIFHHMVVNIIRLLQSLDKDGNPGNGITITDMAKNNAVALDFDLSVTIFQSLSGISSLVANGGQDVSKTELVSVLEATLHLILSLALSEGPLGLTDPETFFMGTWRGAHPDRDFALLSFFEDNSYIHAEVGDLSIGEMSGMEWGTVIFQGQGFAQATQLFDGNGTAGLNMFKPSPPELTWVFYSEPATDSILSSPVVGTPVLEDSAFENAIRFEKIISEGLLGTWVSPATPAELSTISFFDDESYFFAEIDRDNPELMSGMELGTYARDESTGLLTVTQTFDNNGGAGLTDFVGIGAPNVFADVSADTLTLTIDEDGDNQIDKTIIFQRQ
jgi:hypothetical protein